MSPADPPRAGRLRVHDNARPTLPDGTYLLSVATSSTATSGTTSTPNPLPVTDDGFRYLEVAGPKSRLSPGDVVSTYPEADASGGFEGVLPHVVLARHTLPWERTWTDAGVPWLVLLVFAPGELPDGQPVTAAAGVTLTIGADLLARVGPTTSEAALLSHARQVNPADQAAAGTPDGLFAVTIANRTPVAAGIYQALLVSMEGQPATPGSGTAVTLPVLYSWRFTVADTGGTFRGHLEAVAANAAAIGIGRTAPLPLARTGTDGVTTTAGYHGPIVAEPPQATPENPGGFPFQVAANLGRMIAAADGALLRAVANWHAEASAADAGTQDAAASGLADLAGSAQEFLRRAVDRLPTADPWGVPPQIAALHVPATEPASAGSGIRAVREDPAAPAAAAARPGPAAARLRLGPRPGAMTTSTVRAAPARREQRLAGAAATATNPAVLKPAGLRRIPAGEAALRRRLASVQARAAAAARAATPAPASRLDAQAAIAAVPATSDSLSAPVPDTVLALRSDLLALRRIPVSHWLPDPSLLPDESARFFYVDAAWLDAVLTGACTVGALGTAASTTAAAAAAALTPTAASSSLPPGIDPAPDLTVGVLIRSGAVSGWPQLTLRAFGTAVADDADPGDAAILAAQLTPLRLERINPSVLLALFPAYPVRIWVEEPFHGIRHGFGVPVNPGDPFTVPTGSLAGTKDKVDVVMRAGAAPGVVDIGQLAEDIGAVTGVSGSSGWLALQLLEPPYRQVFALATPGA